MAVGASATMDAATLNAQLGAASVSLKSGSDSLLILKQALDPYSPEDMISTDPTTGLGLEMTVEEAQLIKDALAEAQTVADTLIAQSALRRTWGTGLPV